MTDDSQKRVALLRAVNVGGTGKVIMADLRKMAEAMGYSEPTTLLQSGNLVFGGARGSNTALEGEFERALAKEFGVRADVMVRTPQEWEAIIAANPFAAEAEADARFVHVIALKVAPAPTAIDTLRDAIVGNEKVELVGRELYAYYADGAGQSKLTNVLIEKKLETRGTARNWNTITKIAALLGA